MKLDDFSVKSINGEMKSMSDYSGKVLLIVNVASKCGFTKQYSGLQSLYAQHAARGLVVLGFPCDQFGHQEPGDDQEIESFCQTQFEVTFPMFSKIDVNGDDASPLYKWLKSIQPGLLGTEAIKWNFTKFLLGRDGQVIKRYAPMQTPESLVTDIEAALNKTEL
jgi:glutathione peroxidase